jgi:hypothetical protein
MASTVHILAGLEPGDVVITSGLQQMRAGQAVAPFDADAIAADGHSSNDEATDRHAAKPATDSAGATVRPQSMVHATVAR